MPLINLCARDKFWGQQMLLLPGKRKRRKKEFEKYKTDKRETKSRNGNENVFQMNSRKTKIDKTQVTEIRKRNKEQKDK